MTSSRKSTDLKLAIVLLAAGEGSRLGSVPKALLLHNGKSFLETFCQATKSLNPEEFLVITGFHAQAIESELKDISESLNIPVSVKRNPNTSQGQGSSVRFALESLRSNFDVLAICLSDQPKVGAKEILLLLEQFVSLKDQEQIVMPMVNGQRGNPVLFSRMAVKEILSMPGMVCRAYMDQHPELIKVVESNNLAYVLDVDTEIDIQKLGITRL